MKTMKVDNAIAATVLQLQERIDKLEEVVDELCDMWNETALNLIKRIERLEEVEHEDD